MSELTRRRDHRDAGTSSRLRVARVRAVISTLLLLAVSAFALVTVVLPLLLGAHTYTVLTGSMQPGMPPGSMIAVRPAAIDEVRVGDVVTYQIRSGEPAVVTHRVVGTTSSTGGDRLLLTRGDANDADDPPVQSEQLRGVVVLAVPYLGYPAMLFGGQERGALIAAIGVIVVGYGVVLLTFDALRARRAKAAGAALALAAAVVSTSLFMAPPAQASVGSAPAAPLDRLLVSGDGVRFVADGSVLLFPPSRSLAPGERLDATLWIRNASADPARAGLGIDAEPGGPSLADRSFAASLTLVVDEAAVRAGDRWVSGVIPPGDTVRVEVGLRMDAAAGNDTRGSTAIVTPVVRLTEALPAPAMNPPGSGDPTVASTLPWTGLRSTPVGGVVVGAAILAILGLALSLRAAKRR